ncbi:MAG TPA: CRTAC1 family protein, partial [Gemmatimonadaceae bacterium]
TVRPCVADVDNDGHLDLFTANYGKNGLFLNRGAGKFVEASDQWRANADGRYDSCAFADFDNDGTLDLYVNGTVTGGTSYRDYLYQNTRTSFADVTPDNVKSLEADHGVEWADFDNDGDEDLALTGTQPKGMHLVMRNMLAASPSAGWLRVSVVDARGRQSLAGAEVRLYEPGTRQLIGTRILDTGSGYNAQNAIPLHFGLGPRRMVDVEVIAPFRGSRRAALVRNVDARTWAKCALVIRLTGEGAGRTEGPGCR